jgi:outer membrane protein TolC
MKKIFLAALMLLNLPPLFAQSGGDNIRLSLHECVQMAVENNINVVKARIESEKSGFKTNEALSALLPQVSVGMIFQDNLKLPSTMVPGEIFGQQGTSIPVQLGSPYNTNANVNLNLALYNQTALSALKIAKQTEQLNRLGKEKAIENIAAEVAQLYFLAQTTAKQLLLTEDNIARTEHIATICKLLTDNGVSRQVDNDRMNVTLQNHITQRDNTLALYEQQLNMLKYLLGIPQQQTVALTDSVNMSLIESGSLPVSDFSQTVDSRMLASQEEMARLNVKSVNSEYLPTLSLTGQYAYQGLRQEFKNYFKSADENLWLNSSYISINLSIPVFDGFKKRSKARQARLDYDKSSLMLHDANERFGTDYKNAANNWVNNKNSVERQQQNIALAQKVYDETAMKYSEGLATMSDLLQDEMNLNSAQSAYLNALYNFKQAEVQILSLTGRIKELIIN